MRSLQNGSAHIIIIIGLVIALIGALGWIFFMNATNKELGSSTVIRTQSKNDDTSPVKMFDACLQNEKLCFTYPSDWTHTPKQSTRNLGQGDFGIDQDKIQSASKNVTISVETGIDGIGGTCDPEVNSSYFVTLESRELNVQVRHDDWEGFVGNLYAVRTVRFDADTSKYTPDTFLTHSKEIISSGKHAPCSTGYADIFPQREQFRMLFGTTSFVNVDSTVVPPVQSYDTYDMAVTSATSKEFNQAFEILASVRYE